MIANDQVVSLKKTGLRSLQIKGLYDSHDCEDISKITTILTLLSSVVFSKDHSKDENSPVNESCNVAVQRQLAFIESNLQIADVLLPLSFDRLISEYICSSRFYKSLLVMSGDFSIQIGRWCDKEGFVGDWIMDDE